MNNFSKILNLEYFNKINKGATMLVSIIGDDLSELDKIKECWELIDILKTENISVCTYANKFLKESKNITDGVRYLKTFDAGEVSDIDDDQSIHKLNQKDIVKLKFYNNKQNAELNLLWSKTETISNLFQAELTVYDLDNFKNIFYKTNDCVAFEDVSITILDHLLDDDFNICHKIAVSFKYNILVKINKCDKINYIKNDKKNIKKTKNIKLLNNISYRNWEKNSFFYQNEHILFEDTIYLVLENFESSDLFREGIKYLSATNELAINNYDTLLKNKKIQNYIKFFIESNFECKIKIELLNKVNYKLNDIIIINHIEYRIIDIYLNKLKDIYKIIAVKINNNILFKNFDGGNEKLLIDEFKYISNNQCEGVKIYAPKIVNNIQKYEIINND